MTNLELFIVGLNIENYTDLTTIASQYMFLYWVQYFLDLTLTKFYGLVFSLARAQCLTLKS